MICCGTGLPVFKIITWKDMPRSDRKLFHRENESRVRKGLPKLKKESVKRRISINACGGY